MPVHPQCRQILDQMAASPVRMIDMDPVVARKLGDAGLLMVKDLAPPVDLARVEDRSFAGPGGDVAVRVYRPHGAGPFRGVVFYHGGGFVVGNLDTHDPICRLLAARAQAVVVAVDYRLAPEHPFPAAVDDSVAALEWVASTADDLDIDPGRIAVAGDSAGGNLAAVVALTARDRGGPAVGFQALVYPGVTADHDFASMDDNGVGLLLERDTIEWFAAHYLGGQDVDDRDPRVAPLHATTHAGLPPAIVITAAYDPIRDEGEAYADALREAGVAVTLRRYEGMIHGFWNFIGLVDAATEATHEVADAIAEALG